MMVKLRKHLALVLVMAMIFTMLPAFAAAEESVGEAAAVETAPAAVEDVAEISAAPEPAPVAAIETAAAETVAPKAELQALDHGDASFESDAAAVESGYFLKLTSNGQSAYYNDMLAFESNNKTDTNNDIIPEIANKPVLSLLCDYTYTDEAATGVIININSTGTNVEYFTFDLGGHTLVARTGRRVLSRTEGYLKGATVQNGTIIYQNTCRTDDNTGILYSNATVPTLNDGTAILTTKFHLNNVTLISAAHGGSDDVKDAPCIASSIWQTTVDLNNSKVIAERTSAVKYFPSDKFNANKAKQISTINSKGPHNMAINMTGECVLGSLAENTAAVRFVYPATVQAETTAKVQVNIKADAENASVILGSDFCAVENDPGDASRCAVLTPSAYTSTGTYSWPLIDDSTYFEECAILGEDETAPAFLEPTPFPALTPPLCPHEHKEHLDAAPATFAAAGRAECWYCADCGKYWEADGETPTNLNALSTDPKLTPADAAGKTDAELAALDAVTKVTAPDGTVTAYTSIQPALNVANAWTVSGGEVKLLTDYTCQNSNNTSGRLYTISDTTSTYHAYDETIGDDLYGYWFDLGGHTLTFNCPKPAFGAEASAAINFRNGRLIHYNTPGSTGSIKSAITFGYSTTVPVKDGVVRVGRVTLYNAEIVAAHGTGDGGNAKDTIMSSLWNNVIRLYDSKVISRSGQGVGFYLSNASPAGDELAMIQAYGATDVVELHGSSVCGSLNGEAAALRYRSYYDGSPDNYQGVVDGIDHKLTITADAGSKFLGGYLALDDSGSRYELMITEPDGSLNAFTDYSYARPDTATVSSVNGAKTAPENMAAENYAGFYYGAHVHDKQHINAKEPTYTETGCYEHFYCPLCGTYWSADGEMETTEAAVTIPRLACDHADKVHHAPVAPTYASEGAVEYWSCPTCLRFFSDEACENEITEAETAGLPKLVYATGKTDAEMVALGAVVKTVQPDGETVKAFDNLKDAYADAVAWTTAGGRMVLLKDLTVVEEGNNGSGGYFDCPTAAPAYDNTEVETMPTKGFWFDLGGHTLDITLGKGLFYGDCTAFVNIKNGTIIFTSDGRVSGSGGTVALFGAINFGWSTSNPVNASGPKVATVNLYQMNFYTKPALSGTSAAVVASSLMNTTVNIKESNVITTNEQAAVELYRTASTNSTSALLELGANFNVNITGGSKIGSLNPEANGVYLATSSASTPVIDGLTYRFTVTADEDTTFLGRLPTAVADSMLTVYEITRPNSDYSTVQRSYAFPELGLEEASYKAWVNAATIADDSRATFTPVGGEESAQVTLTEAIQAWMASEQGGTVRLYTDISAEDGVRLRSALNLGNDYFYTSSQNGTFDPILLITEEQSHKTLTLDLNNCMVALTDPFLGMRNEVEDVKLTIKNGSVSTTKQRPLMVLKGADVGFVLENAALLQEFPLAASTSGGGNTNTIQDVRRGNSYSILTSSTVESLNRSPLTPYTIASSKCDETILYYIKDCVLYTESSSQPAIWGLKQNDVEEYNRFTFIIDGDTTLHAKSSNGVVNVRHDDCVFYLTEMTYESNTITTDGSASMLTTAEEAKATLTAGELTFFFKDAADAPQIAEAFGRNAQFPAALTLNADATAIAPVENDGCASAFTLDLNGKALPENGFIVPGGAAGTKVTVTMAGSGTAKLFAALPGFTYADGDKFVTEKGSLFTDYSLNLADNIQINLYTKDADTVGYVQDEEIHTIEAADDRNAWVIDTIAAKQMLETIAAYAAKKDGATTKLDFTKRISVKTYVDGNPAATLEEGAEKTALEAVLKSLLVYGMYAEKYFYEDYTDLTDLELSVLGLSELPEIDVSNLTDADYVVTQMDDLHFAPEGEGFYGTSAVLEDSIRLKFYFRGTAFEGKTATVNGQNAALETSGDYKYVEAAVRARDFDAPVTVAIDGVGSVTDSVSGYTSRLSDENAARLAQALRAYGADAMRYAAAKG